MTGLARHSWSAMKQCAAVKICLGLMITPAHRDGTEDNILKSVEKTLLSLSETCDCLPRVELRIKINSKWIFGTYFFLYYVYSSSVVQGKSAVAAAASATRNERRHSSVRKTKRPVGHEVALRLQSLISFPADNGVPRVAMSLKAL